jgi:hypothetical protein
VGIKGIEHLTGSTNELEETLPEEVEEETDN